MSGLFGPETLSMASVESLILLAREKGQTIVI